MWRVLIGLNSSIALSFLPVGHTKFSPDWCFGLFKQKFRLADVGCLNDIAEVARASATVNSVQLIGTQEGEVLVPTYEWTGFFIPLFKKLPGIKKFHHFFVDELQPGIIKVKEWSDSPTVSVKLLRDENSLPAVDTLPDIVQPRGLSPERQWYLYHKIREFCPLSAQDATCPLPSVPNPSSRYSTPLGSPEHSTQSQSPVHTTSPTINHPPTRQRLCGKCGQPGHNRRTCPKPSAFLL